MTTRILIVEDQPIYIDGLVGVIEQDPAIEVAGTAAHGQEALDFLENEAVDIVMLDMNMPVLNGLETLPILQEKYPQIEVIMLTVYDNISLILKFVDLSVAGYLLKDAKGREIREAIHTVAKGGIYYGHEVMKKITKAMRDRLHAKPGQSKISQRERQILLLVVKEYTAQEIADKLFISKETVDTHRKNIREKLGVRNTAGMVREALRQGLIEESEL